jgi:poly-gamma-glutamate synthesis protein (capsule biosynthesis protein)
MMVGNSKETVRLTFLGDIMLGGEFLRFAEYRGMSLWKPFERVIPCFSGSDIIVINLEGPIFEGLSKRYDVTSVLSNHSAILELVKKWGSKAICVLNLANNHIMDYGAEGLRETIRTIESHGLMHLGAGENISKAAQPLKVRCKNGIVGFLAYTTDQRSVRAVIADGNSPGCADFSDHEAVRTTVRSLAKEVDVVCVLLHWGIEYYEYPSPDQVYFARSLVESGSSLVIGHHPHVIQGIEQYKKGLIAYSLGNFFLPPVLTTTGRIQFRKELSKRFIVCSSDMILSKIKALRYTRGWMDKDYHLLPIKTSDSYETDDEMERLSKPILSEKYTEFYRKYEERREKELNREALWEAIYKARSMSLRQLIGTVKLDDFKRNFRRVCEIIKRQKINRRKLFKLNT